MTGSPSEVCKLEREKAFSPKLASQVGEIEKKKIHPAGGSETKVFFTTALPLLFLIFKFKHYLGKSYLGNGIRSLPPLEKINGYTFLYFARYIKENQECQHIFQFYSTKKNSYCE